MPVQVPVDTHWPFVRPRPRRQVGSQAKGELALDRQGVGDGRHGRPAFRHEGLRHRAEPGLVRAQLFLRRLARRADLERRDGGTTGPIDRRLHGIAFVQGLRQGHRVEIDRPAVPAGGPELLGEVLKGGRQGSSRPNGRGIG